MIFQGEFRPIALSSTTDSQLDPNHNAADAAALSYTGGLYVFLDPTGHYLSLAGPTGRGFRMMGNWRPSADIGGAVSNTATGKVTVMSSEGQVPLWLPPGGSFVVSTTGNSSGLYGQVNTTGETAFNVNLDAFNGSLQKLGLSESNLTTPGSSWGIGLGADVGTAFSNAGTGLAAPVNTAVPYIYYAGNGTTSLS